MVAIHITGMHLTVPDDMKTYITDKLGALGRYHKGLSTVHVTVHQAERKGFRVDVDMHLGHHKDVVAHDREDTMHAAIDVVADKCAAQLRKIHAREVHDHRHPAA
jgi:ribosomal subunit interface protein